jgi:putative component of membrane protein insertase Oxa1/YidC/SpoIIIJ protein YidD
MESLQRGKNERPGLKRVAFAGILCLLQTTSCAQTYANNVNATSGCAACGVGLFFIVGLFVLNIALLVWVAKDAKARGMGSSALWVLLVFFTGLIGLVVYLLARPGHHIPMRELLQQEAPVSDTLSSLRLRCMRSRCLRLGCVVAILCLVVLDSARSPQNEITAKLYVGGVHVYQRSIHPLTSRFIKCRFNPTCSHYSTLVVQRFGIRRGLWLTALLLSCCRRSVSNGHVGSGTGKLTRGGSASMQGRCKWVEASKCTFSLPMLFTGEVVGRESCFASADDRMHV